jgi:hypothetical protein
MQRPRKFTPDTGDPRGLRVVGPRFYLWDSDPSEALRLAAELGVRRTRPPLTARRRPPFRAPLA